MNSVNKKGIDVNESLLNLITPSVIKFNEKDIVLGENYCRCYVIIKYPQSLSYGWLGELSSIKGTIMISEFIQQEQSGLVTALSKNINSDSVNIQSERDNYRRIQMDRRIKDGENVLKQIDSNGEKIGKMVNAILVFGSTEEELRKNSDKVISTASKLKCNLRQVQFLLKDGLISISPYGKITEDIEELAGRVSLLSTYLGGFFNLNEGFSDEKGYCFAKDVNGGLMILDLWKRGKDRTNSNIVAVGSSGKGKSTAIKKIILNEYMMGTKILIIDPEREYDEITKALGGDWINLGGSKKGKINPLEIKPLPIEDEENKDIGSALALHLQNLEVFFRLYFSDMTEREKDVLNLNLIKLYEKFNINWDTDTSKLKSEDFPILSDLLEVLEENKILSKNSDDKELMQDYNNLILGLNNLTNGQDQFLFNGKTSLHTDAKIVCLDTHNLDSASTRIKRAQYFNVIGWCWQQITKDRKEKVLLICDEAYLLIDPEVPETLIGLRNIVKRCRKYEGALAVASQSIVDFLDPRIKMYGQALLTMPCYKIFMGSDGKDLQEVVETFNLKEVHKEIIEAGVQGRGLLINGSKKHIFNVEIEDYESKYILNGKGGR